MTEEIEVGGDGVIKGAKHTFDALAGLSAADRQTLRLIHETGFRDEEKQKFNRMLRERRIPEQAPPAYSQPLPGQSPQVVKYLCGTCQGELLPGVQHTCPAKQGNPLFS